MYSGVGYYGIGGIVRHYPLMFFAKLSPARQNMAGLFFATGAWYGRGSHYGKGSTMPTLKAKKGEIKVPASLVVRMAVRMHKLGNETRRQNYIARARKRLEAGHGGTNDAAVVLAAGG